MVEFTYPVSARMPGGITVGHSGLCRWVPCLLSAVNSLRVLGKIISEINNAGENRRPPNPFCTITSVLGTHA